MSAVFTGNGLGFFNSSLTQLGNGLGGSAGLGQGTDRQYVNLATGNLLLQGQDEFLTFRGLGVGLSRTYNSQGLMADVGADGWVTGFERRVSLLSGTFNASGSVMRRYTGDGGYQDFTWVSANTYQSTAGDRAHDTLTWSATDSTWTYVEGTTRRVETYADHASATLQGRLTRIQDARSDGATPTAWNVVYDANNRITEIRSDDGTATGDALLFTYDGNGRLSGVSTRENGATRTQVAYAYDAQGRLSSVTTDLTPTVSTDNTWSSTASANDGKLFRSTYTYEGTTLRVASVQQSDGTLISYTYDTEGRVKTVTRGDTNTNDADGAGETITYTYDTNTTTVTDSLGRAWAYAFDANGQLTQVTAPAVSGQSDVTTYQYDMAGNVTQIKTVRGSAVLSQNDYKYDTNGNIVWEWDALGDAISRTYSASNQVLTEVRYTDVDADGPGSASAPSGGLNTHYVYDTQDRLRFVVNHLAQVTEIVYAASGNGVGQQSSVRSYLGASYSGGWTEAELVAWATDTQKATSTLVEFGYDAWGRLSQRTEYAAVDATTGTGILDAAAGITRYVYDAQGLLRQQIAVRGASRTLTGEAPSGSEQTTYVYDGLGRLLSVTLGAYGVPGTDASTQQTTYVYTDSALKIATTTDAGVVHTELRNAAGRLLSVSEVGNAGGGSQTRTTNYTYDSAGQLRIGQDAGGGRSFHFYDAKGRLEATVDATGAVIQTTYDGADQVIQTRAFANRVTTTGWTDLLSVPADVAAIGVTADDAVDRVMQYFYDAAGRLIATTDGLASDGTRSVTEYTYNGLGQLIRAATTDAAHTASTARIERYFYDSTGRQIATLDAEGYLTEMQYDRAGRLIVQIRYSVASPSDKLAEGTLAELRPTSDTDELVTRYFYNGRGQQVGVLDAQNYLTEYVIDEAGNTRAERRYATATAYQTGDTLATLRDRAGTARESRRAYNSLGQLATELNAEGTATRYTYDEAGRLVKTEAAQGTSEVRENNRRYNAFGELIGELGGEGSTHLLSTMSEAELDALYAQYGVRHSYDVMGRRIESIDAAGNKTWYFYDSVGRATFTVRGGDDGAGVKNAQGEVTETRYTAFGDASDTIAYTGRIAIATPGSRDSVAGAISTLAYLAATDSRRQYVYTTRGQLARLTDAEGSITAYTYNAFGELSRVVTASGQSTASTTDSVYNRRGEMTQRTEGVGTSVARTMGWGYDAFGRVVSTVDGRGGTTAYGFDRLGRQVSVSQTVQGRTEKMTTTYNSYEQIEVIDAKNNATTYAYDPVARSLTVISPEGVSIATAHNRHGQTLTVTDDAGRVVVTNTYNLDGQLTLTKDALNQEVQANTYDARGLLVSTVDASGRNIELRYDAAGRVLQRIEDPGSGKLNLTTSYAYDGQGRQLTVTDPSGRVVGYSYDREGRIKQIAQDPAGLNYRTVFAYDLQGRQVSVTEGYSTSTAKVTQYAYDALGRRTSEVVDPGTGKLNLTISYVYDANDNVIRRTDANGAVTRYFYDEANRPVYTVDALGGVTKNWYDVNGRLAAVRTYAQRLTAQQLNDLTDATTIVDVDTLPVEQTSDSGLYSVYNEDGQLQYSVDMAGGVEQTLYDAAGRVIGTRAFAAKASLTIALVSKLRAGTAIVSDLGIAANNALDRRDWQVLDAAGHVRYTVDGLGNTREIYYDTAGRVVGGRSYATAIALDATLVAKLDAGTAVLADISAKLSAADAKDLRNYQVFDEAGRLRYTVDAFGAVTEYYLDAAGRTVGTRRYAQAIAVDATLLGKLKAGTAGVADLAAKVSASDAADQQTYLVYDAAGRACFTVEVLSDVAGNVSAVLRESRYDALGRVVETRDRQTLVSTATLTSQLVSLRTGTASLSTVADWMTGTLRTTHLVYDAAGRARYTLQADTSNSLTVRENRYDGVGRVIAEVVYGVTIPSATAKTSTDIAAALEAASGNAAANQRMTRWVHDAGGNLRFTIDDLGGVAELRYDGLGRLVESRQYAQAIPVATAATESAVSAALAGQTGSDVRVTTTAYDGAGRVTSVVDAAESAEFYAYDALGNRISYTDKLDGVWTYAYDAVGRLVSETSPQVSVFTSDDAGNLTPTTRSVVTQTAYDALGNVIQRTEDATGANPRITQYQYDNRGNQVKTIFPDAGKIDAGTGAIVASGVQPPSIDVVYDALGQAIVQKDVLGNYSYKVYDSLGQRAYDIDQEGYVSGYVYDAFGEQTSLRRYSEKLNFASIGGWAAGSAISLAQMTATVLVANNSQDRTLTYTYDNLGRKTSVKQQAVTYVKADGTTASGTPTTQFAYNLYGEVVKTSVLLDATNDLWASTFQYYDDLGRNTVTVDAEGYVTRMAYNATGEVIEATEYARALDAAMFAGLTTTTMPVMPASGDEEIGYDRTTRWEYDAMGRKSAEISIRHYQNAGGSTDIRDVRTGFTYDAAGHVTQTILDAGTTSAAVTSTQYDALGRVVSVLEPGRAALKATAESLLLANVANRLEAETLYEQVSPYSTMGYDAFGNLLTVRRYANGWTAGSSTAPAVDNARDQVQVTRYDWQGRAVWEKDAEGAVVTRTYDAADHLLTTTYWLNSSEANVSAKVVTTATYDKLGQQLTTVTSRQKYNGTTPQGGELTDASESVRYNAFGEIIAKDDRSDAGLEAASFAVQYGYDQSGQMVSDNGTGATRNYGYDLAGNLVKEWHQAYLNATDGHVTAVTRSIRDRLGRVVRMALPSNTANAAAAIAISQRFDRWGNLIEVNDARGFQTNYQYNDQNQRTREIQPLVKVVSNSAEGEWRRPEQSWYYDALGRMVGSRDANGNLTRYEYDAAGQQVKVIDANSDVTAKAYDVLGSERYAQDGLGHVTYKGYDRLGRVTEHGDYLPVASGSGREKKVLESYQLDADGNRIVVTNAMDKASRYEYDSRGLMLRSQSAMGVVMEYAYDLAGRKIRETYDLTHTSVTDVQGESVRLNEQTWDYDYYGQLTDHNDLGGQDYDYDNDSGQLKIETNSRGLSRATSYYANGQVREIQEPNGVIYRYEYDASGNVIVEETITKDSRGKDVKVRTDVVYDSHNRMQRIVQDDLVTTKRVFELTYDYDAAGNRTHVLARTGYGTNTAPIEKVDQAPVVIGLPDARVIRSGIVSEFRVRLSDIFRDPEGKSLVVSAVQVVSGSESALPGWLSSHVDTATGEMVFNATAGSSAANGQDFTIRLKAADAGGLTASANFSLMVRANTAPVDKAGATTQFSVRIGQSWSADLRAADYFSDLDVGDSLSISINGVSPAAPWLSINGTDPTVARLSGSPVLANAGTYVVTLRATDQAGATKTRTITLVVSANVAPTVTGSIPDHEIGIGRTFTIDIPVESLFFDANGDAMQYQVALAGGGALPAWITYQHLAFEAPPVVRLQGQVPVDSVNGTSMSFTLMARDTNGATAQTSFNLLLVDNLKPVQTQPIPNQSVARNAAFTYQVPVSTFTDPEGRFLTYTATGLPPGITFTASTRTFSGTPSTLGNYTVTLTASDGQGGTSSTTFALSVVNTAPTAPAIPDQTANAGSGWSYLVPAFSDPNGDALTYTVVGLPSWMSFNASTLTLSGTPGAVGSWTVTVTATDPSGASVSDSFMVTTPNVAPTVATVIPTQNVPRNAAWSYQVPAATFNDKNGDALTYTASGMPAGITFDASTRTFSGTSTAALGNYTVTVTASDGRGGSVSTAFTVSLVNSAPVVANPIPSQSASATVAWSYQIPANTFSDANGDALTYTAYDWAYYPQYDPGRGELVWDWHEQALPSWLTFDAATRTFSGTPPSEATFTFRVYASDGSGTRALDEFDLTVGPMPNYAPTVATPIPDQTANATGGSWSYAFPVETFADVNGDTLTYAASGMPGWMSFNASTRTFSGTPGAVGSWTVTVTATDPSGASVSDSFTVTTPNVAPTVATAIPTQNVPRNAAWSYQVPAATFNDKNGDALTYTASGMPAGITFDASTRTFSGAPTAALGNYTVTVTASDGRGGSVSTTFTISLVNSAPVVANPIPSQSASATVAWSYQIPANTFSDANGDALTYTAYDWAYYPQYDPHLGQLVWDWHEQALPSWLTFDAATRTFSGTPPSEATFTFRVYASDGSGTRALDEFDLTVGPMPNYAPTVATPIPNQTASATGGTWSYAFPTSTFSDANGDALTYTASGMPSWMSFNASTRTFSGTPGTVGSWTVTVTARDPSGATVSDSFTVTTPNVAPVIVTAMQDFSITANQAWSYTVPSGAYVDRNGQALTYSASGLPAGITFNASTRTFSGTPTATGTFTVNLTVSDGSLSVTDSFVITVSSQVNVAPIVNRPLVDQEGYWDGDYIVYTFAADSFVDPNGDSLAYTTSTLPVGLSFDAATRTFSGSLAGGKYGKTYVITVTASDGRGGSVSDSFTIHVDGYMEPLMAEQPASSDLSAETTFIGAESVEGDMSPMLIIDPPDDGGGGGGGGGGGTPVPRTQESWYAYDRLNRVSVVNGDLDAQGNIVVAERNTSYGLSYDAAGNQVGRYYWDHLNDGTAALTTVRQEYSLRGELLREYNDRSTSGMFGGGLLGPSEERLYDAAGRVVEVRTFYPFGTTMPVLGSDGYWRETPVGGWWKSVEYTTYDDDGRALRVETHSRNEETPPPNAMWATEPSLDDGELSGELGLTEVAVISYEAATNRGYDAAGRVKGYTYTTANYTHTYTYAYEGRDSYLEKTVTGSSTNNNYKTTTSTMSYDAAGRQTEIREHTNGVTIDDRVRSFAHDGNGMILSRRDGTVTSGDVFQQNATGSALGRMNLHNVYAGRQLVAGLDEAGKIDALSRLTGFSNSESGRTQVMVQQGDTLYGLAQRVYGNGNLWYVIAEANGLLSDADLVVGTSVTVPEVKTSSNDASTFKPYNPSETTGPTTPGLPYIQPPPKSGCGTLGMIIMIVVAVVVTVYTAGALSGVVGAAMGSLTTGSAMAIGAIAGAAGAAASMAVGSAMGVASFSWRGVAAGAITGAITGGLLGQFGSVGDALNGTIKAGVQVAPNLGKAAALSLANAGANYAGQKLAGVDVSFSWNSIAASAVSSVVAAKVTPGIVDKMKIQTEFGYDFASGMTGGVVSAAVRSSFGQTLHRSDYMTVVADAFGNALGNKIVRDNRATVARREAAKEEDSFLSQHPYALASTEGSGIGEPVPEDIWRKATGSNWTRIMSDGDIALMEADILALEAQGRDMSMARAELESYRTRLYAPTDDGITTLAPVEVRPDPVDLAAWQANQGFEGYDPVANFIGEMAAYNAAKTPAYRQSVGAMLRQPSQAEIEYFQQHGRPMPAMSDSRPAMEFAARQARNWAAIDAMRNSPSAAITSLATRALGGSNDAATDAAFLGQAIGGPLEALGTGRALRGGASGTMTAVRSASARPRPANGLGGVESVANAPQYVFDARVGRYRETATGQFAAARNLPWPDNAGFASSSMQTVKPGTVLDRFGSETGRFLGEPGATVSQRGMAQGAEAMPYTQYRVLKPFDARVGPAAPVPAFGASGGATQYLSGRTVQQLIRDGYLEVIR